MSNSTNPILLQEKLEVLRLQHLGDSPTQISEKIGCSPDSVQRILSQKGRITKCSSPNRSRKYLTLGDRLRVVCRVECGDRHDQICTDFNISIRTLQRIVQHKMKWKSQGMQGSTLNAKKALFPRYPEVDAEIERFINFARNQRLPVTRALIQQRAMIAAKNQGIVGFQASNGYVQKFLRRTRVHKSIRLHGRGGSALPGNHTQRMAEIQDIASQYSLSNIYNMDESGLMYRMGPRRSYLSGNENPSTTRGTDLQKYKARITIVLCVNADGSHSVPVRYIGNSAEPRCLRDLRFSSLTLNYDSQKKAWMDSARFDKWMKWWYTEVRKRTTGDILLIMDNCGGHESSFDYPGLRVEFLPPK